MCEHFVVRGPSPFRLDELWPFTERLERYGVAGFGWGVAWVDADDGVAIHRSVSAFRDDRQRETVGRQRTTAALVHLRRPSRLSTLGLPDAQPFADPAGRFAFSHNGDLREWRPWRTRYRREGRIHGRADSEVGARWLEDAWDREPDRARLLADLHATFGGQANLALLLPDGAARMYAGNSENPVFAFRLGHLGVVSTGIYSLDRSLFRFVVPKAAERRLLRVGAAVALDEDGTARPAA